MIPFADLVNHQSYVESFYGATEEDAEGEMHFQCWATEAFAPGAEIFQSYGSHRSSAHFLLYYGFIPDDYTSSDFVTFALAAAAGPESNTTGDSGASGGDGGKRSGNSDSARIDGDQEGQLFASVGLVGVDGRVPEAFVEALCEQLIESGAVEDEAPAAAVYRAALLWMSDVVEDTIAAFATSYEEDLAMLGNGFQEHSTWATLIARTRYKRILIDISHNIHHRIKHGPEHSDGWRDSKKEYLLVYDEDEFAPGAAWTKALGNSLYHVVLTPSHTTNASTVQS
jgi:hypothetical protein